ncbi:MAG TPA: F0F1 ATP synthase subunit delta [Acidiferrobacterales bacterium]|jgi:F-type H+-transporting ATPase subunit delta
MSERSTLARPYAEAAFGLARQRQELQKWSAMLRLAAGVAGDPQMAALLDNPRQPRERVTQMFLDVCGDRLDPQGVNFIRVLRANGRLGLLAEIATQFELLKAAAEGRVDAEVTSAFALSPDQIAGITGALKKKLGRDVSVVSKIDESLVGGVVIRAGDLVIDGSVHGQLRALTSHLNR